MKPFPNRSLAFQDTYHLGDQFWEYGKVLHDDSKLNKPLNWLLTYRYAIRAMLARFLTIDKEYQELNTIGFGLCPIDEKLSSKEHNEWNIIWESHAGVLFFAMDSSMECFAYAINALGVLLDPSHFFDITNEKALRKISPSQMFSDTQASSAQHLIFVARRQSFPLIFDHWNSNRILVQKIMDYHDATKHRHSAVVGQATDRHFLMLKPKQPMGRIVFRPGYFNGQPGELVPHDEDDCLQSLTFEYYLFMTEWLQIAAQSIASAFGHQLSSASTSGG